LILSTGRFLCMKTSPDQSTRLLADEETRLADSTFRDDPRSRSSEFQKEERRRKERKEVIDVIVTQSLVELPLRRHGHASVTTTSRPLGKCRNKVHARSARENGVAADRPGTIRRKSSRPVHTSAGSAEKHVRSPSFPRHPPLLTMPMRAAERAEKALPSPLLLGEGDGGG